MIQPTLMSYTLDQEPQAALLDSVSIKEDTILLLDTFFHLCIWHGTQVAQWRKAGYQDQEDYAHFKAQLEAPIADAQVRSCESIQDQVDWSAAGTAGGSVPGPALGRDRSGRVPSALCARSLKPVHHCAFRLKCSESR
jgi:hypothetical protein